MKKLIQSLILSAFIFGCSEDEIPKRQAELDHPRAMNVYCNMAPDKLLSRIEYKYDQDNLVGESTFSNGVFDGKTTFSYASDNRLLQEIYESGQIKIEKTYQYNPSNQLINVKHKYFDYDSNGQLVNERESEAPLEYENNHLVKEWRNWGGFTTYEYKNGKVITMTDYTQEGSKHHVTMYQYDGDLLTDERKETADGNQIYMKTFYYDAENRLINIMEDGKTIEENFYDENKLVEKRIFYFGIDPGFSACYGNYIYKYEY